VLTWAAEDGQPAVGYVIHYRAPGLECRLLLCAAPEAVWVYGPDVEQSLPPGVRSTFLVWAEGRPWIPLNEVRGWLDNNVW
jgi:hypothetical protein